jgi:hypothetical protein
VESTGNAAFQKEERLNMHFGQGQIKKSRLPRGEASLFNPKKPNL